MQHVRKRTWQLAAGLLLVTSLGVAMLFTTRSVAGGEDDHGIIARGAGTTIIHGGTGPSGGFVPVLTTLAFHAERFGGVVAGAFECPALAPGAATGAGSGQFTVNAMYVTGQISKTHLAIAAAESGWRAHYGTLVGLIEALETLAGRGSPVNPGLIYGSKQAN